MQSMFKIALVRYRSEHTVKVEQLRPLPNKRTQFAWPYHVAVPEQPGCYALVTYGEEVLYVGLATGSVRDRMGMHLDTPTKRAISQVGTAYWFYYVLADA